MHSELLRMAKEGSPQDKKYARDQLILNNTGLIWSVVRRFQGRGYDREDLFQIGVIGLMKCVDNFDLNRDVMFSTYAVPLIMGEIRKFLRDDGALKVSRSLKELFFKMKKEEELFLKTQDRLPTMAELSEKLQVPQDDMIMAMESGQEIMSLHQVVYQGEGDEIYLEDRIEQERDTIEETVNQIYIEELLGMLEGKERKLIQLRYFENKTQAAVAQILGMSQVQVSRLEKKILERLRDG